MKLSEFKIDAKRAEQGDWVDDIPNMGDLRLKVRGIQNRDFRKRNSQLIDAEPRQNRIGGRLRPESQDKIFAICLLDTVLIDWEGLIGADDQPIPYSREQAEILLSDPDWRAFRDAVSWAANVVGESTAEDTAEAGNGSKKRSAGT